MKYMILFSLALSAYGSRQGFFVQAAAGLERGQLHSKNQEDQSWGPGLSTYVGHHLPPWGVMISSYILLARYDKSWFAESGRNYRGKSRSHSVAFGPQIRYLSKLDILRRKVYITGGYLWGQLTHYPRASTFPRQHKLIYPLQGPVVSFGLIQSQADSPLFIELSYRRLKADKVHLVPRSQSLPILRSGALEHVVQEHSMGLHLGMEFL